MDSLQSIDQTSLVVVIYNPPVKFRCGGSPWSFLCGSSASRRIKVLSREIRSYFPAQNSHIVFLCRQKRINDLLRNLYDLSIYVSGGV